MLLLLLLLLLDCCPPPCVVCCRPQLLPSESNRLRAGGCSGAIRRPRAGRASAHQAAGHGGGWGMEVLRRILHSSSRRILDHLAAALWGARRSGGRTCTTTYRRGWRWRRRCGKLEGRRGECGGVGGSEARRGRDGVGGRGESYRLSRVQAQARGGEADGDDPLQPTTHNPWVVTHQKPFHTPQTAHTPNQ
jgi:hypothetical protein